MSIKRNKFFVTCGYLGFSKFASGTVASFFTAILSYVLLKFSSYGFEICLALLAISVIFGFTSVDKYLKINNSSDPKEVVIDEFAGQIITIMLSYFCIYNDMSYFLEKITILSFIFFRIFDIMKTFPVNYFDNIDNSFGVMMDDIVAGVMAFFMVFLTIQIFH